MYLVVDALLKGSPFLYRVSENRCWKQLSSREADLSAVQYDCAALQGLGASSYIPDPGILNKRSKRVCDKVVKGPRKVMSRHSARLKE